MLVLELHSDLCIARTSLCSSRKGRTLPATKRYLFPTATPHLYPSLRSSTRSMQTGKEEEEDENEDKEDEA